MVFINQPAGSFLEFLPILTNVQKQYASDPASLPYHLIVPSVPGYGFTKISVNKNMTVFDASRILNKLMVKLGFTQYIAQGGDVGSMITKTVVEEYDECIGESPMALSSPFQGSQTSLEETVELTLLYFSAGHVNMLMLNPPEGEGIAPPTEVEQVSMARALKFRESGMAYAMLHGTRPSTASFAIGTSPQSMLAW